MKTKILAIMLVLVLALSACGKDTNTDKGDSSMTDNSNKEYVSYSVLPDKDFQNGFYVRGLGQPIYGDPIETFGTNVYDTTPPLYFQYGKVTDPKKSAWRLCQWATRYPFHDIQNTSTEMKNGVETFNYRFTDKGAGKYLFANQSKEVEVDTLNGELRLALKASECYKHDRTSGQEWPHLLLEQYLCTPENYVPETKIADATSLKVNVDVKINSFVDNMGKRADPSLHSAMFLFYLFVANYDEATNRFTDMLWFGLPIFDNRTAFTSEASFPDVGSKGSASEKWIFNIATNEFFDMDNNLYDSFNGDIIFDEWKNVNVELLPLVKRAFKSAQDAGYMPTSRWENLHINGMYMGFELPGNYDIDMSVKNPDIIVEKYEKF